MRSRAPSLHSATATRLPAACSAMHVLAHRLEHVGARLGALGGEVVAGARADIDDVAGRRAPRTASAAPAPRVERARAIRLPPDRAGPAAAACRPACTPSLQRLAARVVIIGDLRQAARARRPRPAARARAACPADNRTACRACRGTAAASAPCRDSGGLRSPPRRADRPASAAPNSAT